MARALIPVELQWGLVPRKTGLPPLELFAWGLSGTLVASTRHYLALQGGGVFAKGLYATRYQRPLLYQKTGEHHFSIINSFRQTVHNSCELKGSVILASKT